MVSSKLLYPRLIFLELSPVVFEDFVLVVAVVVVVFKVIYFRGVPTLRNREIKTRVYGKTAEVTT